MGVAHNHTDIARIQRRSLRVVVASQILGGAGLTAGITVGALLAQDLLGTDAVGGLPTALFTLGSALSAFLVGRFTHRLGRRLGLGLGFTAGGLGAIGVVIALAGAGGGAMSGVVVSASSFAVLSLSGGLLSILLIPVLWWAQHRTAPLHSRDDRTI